MNADDIRRAIWRHYRERCAVLFEISTDAQPEVAGTVAGQPFKLMRRRQIDVLTVNSARKQGIGPLDLLAIEIKVSRSDFFADVKEPQKQGRWRQVAHRHAFAAPEGLLRKEEIPAGSGLITVGSEVKWAVRAPYGHTPELPPWLTLTLAYRLASAEAKIRGITRETEAPGATAEDLRAALVEARHNTEQLAAKLERAQIEASEWKAAFAAVGTPLPCMHCGKPVRPRSLKGGYFSKWRHVDLADDGPCTEMRVHRWADIEPADDIPVPEIAS